MSRRETPFDMLARHADAHPVLVTIADTVIAGGGGFIIGGIGVDSSIKSGTIFALVLGTAGFLAGLGSVSQARRRQGKPGVPVADHVGGGVVAAQSHRADTNSTVLVRIRESRLVRLEIGAGWAVAAIGAYAIGLNAICVVFTVIAAFFLGSAKFSRLL